MRRSSLFLLLAAFAVSAASCRGRQAMHPSIGPGAVGSRVELGRYSDVLYVLDGRVLARNDSTGVPPAVRNLDRGRIRSIEVLKGEMARRAFGEAGASGVVIITTTDGR
jgi:hypothetical protein